LSNVSPDCIPNRPGNQSYGEIARALAGRRPFGPVARRMRRESRFAVLGSLIRVLAANGKVWRSFFGGLNWKRELLAREGVSL